MKKIFVIAIVMLSPAACKTKKSVVAEGNADEEKAVKEIIAGHYKNAKDFKTLLIKASVDYKDKKTRQSINAEVRIKKDETILVSVRFIGITMAKAIITPTRVSYYEKINGTYFDGNYAALSKWLGTELDFSKVQNLLLGNAIYDLDKGKYMASLENGQYKLESMERSAISKLFLFEGANYLLKKELIKQVGLEPRSLEIAYPSHKEYPKAILPATINIVAEQKDNVMLNIEYNTITFDENLTFPYDVPEGFDQIFID